jgi:hypothetical protein
MGIERRRASWNFFAWLSTRLDLLLALALLLAAGIAAFQLGQPEIDLEAAFPQVEPRLDPQIIAIREKLYSGQAHGEHFSIVISDRSAAEAVTWFLSRHNNVPFSRPQVAFDPQGVTGSGLAYLFGVQTPVYGRAALYLQDGKPQVKLLNVAVGGAAAPQFVLQAVEAELQQQINAAQNLPFILTRLELHQGDILVEGIFQ